MQTVIGPHVCTDRPDLCTIGAPSITDCARVVKRPPAQRGTADRANRPVRSDTEEVEPCLG